ncbi:sigma-54-dependent Fis family transcriptional regulator [Acidocella aminolytica]|uniref:Transcriptional regulator Fis n=1 Tax=Acidocella aminolytica 101 = DSM 11237 TaxID=1120923 RepID=A0A0D6PEI7_9PROT|nr:sigma-54-dependent Fis family transcriptional regulator [Acidocella aminolytica]GAN80160.1 transcriptional regulator Fis [Acidocella aminolytica 101 = DSM 11237]SHE88134.1 Transcriptional regulator of acetoin/glycerol metabolism [Acidocella aminolytica 101 = DSM 11237]
MEPFRLAALSDRLPASAGQTQGVDPGDISRSWQRCRMAGLAPEQNRVDQPHFSSAERRVAAERRSTLITHARPIMDYFYGQIKDSGCVMLLSDDTGLLLESAGDLDFCNRAAKVALTPGASWAEDARGTNAIGTALIEGKPIVVNGTEHYLRHNSFLACAAAPLTEPGGKLLGVIDISCDSRRYHPHTFGLVRAAAQMIENRIFEISFAHNTKLRFHYSSECLGSMVEGAIAIDEEGVILGANRSGFALLGLRPEDIGTQEFGRYFGLTMRDLIDMEHRAGGRPLVVHPRRGETLYVSVEQTRGPLIRRPPLSAPEAPKLDALAALDTGDERVNRAISQLRRVLGRKVPVLLQGETGAGKDFFARAIHEAGPRANGPFVAVNCAALPETLIEAELFGHAPGAFTGARKEGSAGRIREAHGGTLFLDEIGDMPLSMQTRLLRVLEEGVVTPIGGKPVAVDFLLVSATHADFSTRIAEKTFREDLYYRLNGLAVSLPPLRERTDLPALINRILEREAQGRQVGTPRLSPELAKAFAEYRWPGNLRQLSGILRTACLMLDDDETELCLHHLSEEAMLDLTTQQCAPKNVEQPGGTLRAQSDAMIAGAVSEAGGNIAAAARALGISRNTLYRRLAAMRTH